VVVLAAKCARYRAARTIFRPQNPWRDVQRGWEQCVRHGQRYWCGNCGRLVRPLMDSLVDRAAAVVIVVTADALRTVGGATRRILTSPRLPFRFAYAVLPLGASAAVAEAVAAGVPAPGRSRSRFGGSGGGGDHQWHRHCCRRCHCSD